MVTWACFPSLRHRENHSDTVVCEAANSVSVMVAWQDLFVSLGQLVSFLPYMMISSLKTQGKDAHSSGIVLNYVRTLSILRRLISRGNIIKKLDIEQHIYWCSRERQAMEAGISSFPYRWAVPADGKETNQVSLIQWHSPKNGKDPCALCSCPVSCTWPGLKICLIKSELEPGEAT